MTKSYWAGGSRDFDEFKQTGRYMTKTRKAVLAWAQKQPEARSWTVEECVQELNEELPDVVFDLERVRRALRRMAELEWLCVAGKGKYGKLRYRLRPRV